ncbi:MAG: outer membrane protein assembly factor BamD [Bdellovibrionales bacterium]|nr:outer membrane protein assembly factor BamD [Bdellovibrionales bacterium]
MTKHGCFSLVRSNVENSLKNATRQKPSGLLINVALVSLALVFLTTGCANAPKGRVRIEQRLSKEEILERKLRRMQSKIETLRERNLILKSRIKMISRSGGVEPLGAKEGLNGFDNGVVLDVPIDTRREPAAQLNREPAAQLGRDPAAQLGREPAAQPARMKNSGREEVLNKIDLRPESRKAERPRKIAALPRRLPQKHAGAVGGSAAAVPDSARGEQADRALVRTIVALLKEQDFAEAERTATLLEKSYPDSSALAEAKFQIGLAYFRARTKVAGALQKADGFFAESLTHTSGHIRVKAGASLMRGIIAKRIGLPSGDSRNLEIATRNFKYVISTFPKTSEARRARAELSALNRRVK